MLQYFCLYKNWLKRNPLVKTSPTIAQNIRTSKDKKETSTYLFPAFNINSGSKHDWHAALIIRGFHISQNTNPTETIVPVNRTGVNRWLTLLELSSASDDAGRIIGRRLEITTPSASCYTVIFHLENRFWKW